MLLRKGPSCHNKCLPTCHKHFNLFKEFTIKDILLLCNYFLIPTSNENKLIYLFMSQTPEGEIKTVFVVV